MAAGLDDVSWLTPQTPACTGGFAPGGELCPEATQHSPTPTMLPLASARKETQGTTPP